MSALQVKNVPDPLHDRIRARARAEGMSVSEYVLDALKRDLALPGPRAWAARVQSRESIEGLDALAALDAGRQERGAELAGASRRR